MFGGGGVNPLEGRVKDPEMRGGEGGVGISLVDGIFINETICCHLVINIDFWIIRLEKLKIDR